MNQPSPGGLLYLVLIAAIIVLRNLRPRRIRAGSLWITPIIITVLSVYILIMIPERTPVWLRSISWIIGICLGTGFGFFRGKVTPIRIGELPGTIYVRPALAASLLWVGAFGLRYWIRTSAHDFPVLAAFTDALILFPAATYVAMYLVFCRKYQRLKMTAADSNASMKLEA
jgi:hypothetical protein